MKWFKHMSDLTLDEGVSCYLEALLDGYESQVFFDSELQGGV